MEGEGRRDGVPGVGWAVWAVGVVPVMMILPMYVFPLPFPPYLNAYTGRRLLEILWVAGLLVAFTNRSVRAAVNMNWSALSRTARVAGGIFVGWALLSALASSAPPYALREWSLLTLLLIITFPLAAIFAPRRSRVLEVVGLTLVLYAVLIAPTPLETSFAHPRFQGQVLAGLVPPLLFAGQWPLALMAAPPLALGIVNGSRALVLAVAATTMVAWLLWPDRRRTFPPALVALGLAGVLVGLYVASGAGTSLSNAVERGVSSTGRDRLWLDALRRFLAAPLLGEGPGLLARSPGVGGWAGHPHNSVLLIAAELGSVGLAAFTVLVARGAKGLRQIAADRRPWALALISGGIHSLFSGTTVMPASQALLVLAIGMALPTSDARRRDDPLGPVARKRQMNASLVLAGIGVLALIVLLSTVALPAAPPEPRLSRPRFFLNGILP